MQNPLLITKLQLPPLRPDIVRRSRLTQKLDEWKSSKHRLILVSAPAGFGKTTLITDWLNHKADARIAWLSLDEQDNDPSYFLKLLVAALQQINGSIGRTVQQALQLPQTPPLTALIASLINDMADESGEMILVLDDLHLITHSAIHQMLELMIDHFPQSVTTVIITREDPALPLSRWRVRGQLAEIREHQLRFTTGEIRAFFQDTIRLTLPDRSIDKLSAQTEGWVAGLQLAGLALQSGRVDPAAFLSTFSGSDRYVTDYLIAEVLQYLPVEVQAFLKQTAILTRLTAPLCDALSGRADSQAVLDYLDANNLFVISLDHQRTWYRYYRLFAEFLQAQLTDSEQRALHLKASGWYEANSYPDHAFQHALSAKAYDHAERLILQTAETLLHSGGILILANRLAALPEERRRSRADLAIYSGITAVLTGQIDEAEKYAEAAETHLPAAIDIEFASGQLALLRAFIALARRDDTAGISFANEALQSLIQPDWRIMALWPLAEAYERTGNVRAAIAALSEARQIGYAQPALAFNILIDSFLMKALNEYGQLQQAIAIGEQALTHYVSPNGESLPIAALILARMALLMLEANRVEEARGYHKRFETLASQLYMDELQDLAQGIYARILAASGETGGALEILRKLQQSPVRETISDNGWLTADAINLQLRQGRLADVQHWVEQTGWSSDDPIYYLQVEEYLAVVHYLILAADIDEAGRWLARLHHFIDSNALVRKQIDIHILQALTAVGAGDLRRARDHMKQALQIAEPQGYIHVFLDYGPQVVELLSRIRESAPAFVDKVLNAARILNKQPLAQSLIDPLSEREIEVLGLVAAGLSNGEIADRLFISVGTVKRHINHIYGKLAVQTRTQAIVRGRELNLLS